MLPLRAQAKESHAALLEAVNLSAEQMQVYSDRIQKRARARPDLTRLCEFTGTIQVRRLLLVPPTAWQMLEVRWARHLLAKLNELKQVESTENTLALACLGYARKGADESQPLDYALVMLDAEPAKQAEEEVPSPTPKQDGEEKPKRTATRNRRTSPPAPLPKAESASPKAERGEESEEGVELDPETEAQLAALRVETAKLKR